MHKRLRKIGFAAFFLFVIQLTSYANGEINPIGEIGRVPISDKIAFRLEMKNDSIASLSKKDWDDLRTFGLYMGISARKWALEITEDALTNRESDSTDRGRIDELHVSVSRQIFSWRHSLFSASFAAGPGMIYLGNMGLCTIQKEFHKSYGNKRPFPDNYEDPEKNIIGMAEGVFQAHWNNSFVPLAFFSSIEAGHTGFYRTGNFANATILDGFLGVDVCFGVRQAGNYREEGTTFTETLNSENGIQYGADFRVGFVSAGYTFNISTTRQNGYFALEFGSDRQRVKPGVSGTEHIRAIEYNLYPLISDIRLRSSIVEYPFVISPVLGAGSNKFTPKNTTVQETEIYLYEQLYAGVDLSKNIFPWMEGFLMGASGIRLEMHRTRYIESSQVLESKTGDIFFAEGGLRLFLPAKGNSSNQVGVGLAAGIQYTDEISHGLTPYIHMQIIGTTGRKH